MKTKFEKFSDQFWGYAVKLLDVFPTRVELTIAVLVVGAVVSEYISLPIFALVGLLVYIWWVLYYYT